MVANGKLYANKNRCVFVMSPSNGCPRFISIEESVRFRDDFGGQIKTVKTLAKLLAT
jgi:hypothetical protein